MHYSSYICIAAFYFIIYSSVYEFTLICFDSRLLVELVSMSGLSIYTLGYKSINTTFSEVIDVNLKDLICLCNLYPL